MANNTTNDPRIVFGHIFFPHSWIFAELVTSVSLLLITWVIISLITFIQRHRKVRAKNSIRLMSLATLVIITIFFRFISSQALIFIDRLYPLDVTGDQICKITCDVTTIFYTFTIFSTYIFLFYRQRLLYSEPSLKHLNNPFIIFLSVLLIILLVVGSASSAAFFIFSTRFIMSNFGCIRKIEDERKSQFRFIYLSLVVRLCSNLILFFLFLNLLLRHQQKSNSERTSHRAMKSIRSATLSMVTCVVTDVAAVVIVVELMPPYLPMPLANGVLDLNLITNLFAIVFCFHDNRKILFGNFKRVKTSRVRSSANRGSNTQHSAVAVPNVKSAV